MSVDATIAPARLPRLAIVSVSVAATATVALAAWILAPQLSDSGWRWGAVAIDTVGLLCACAAFARLRPGPELLTLLAAGTTYVVAVLAAATGLPPVAFLTAGLASLVAALVGVLSGAAAAVTGARAWPRWFALALLAAIVLAVVGHGLLGGWDRDAFLAGVATLTAGAPAALAVAVLGPLALGARRLGANGLRLVDTSALEASERVTTLVLDGLATVVKGMHVSAVEPIEESHLRNLKWFAGALEHASEDPVGRAIAKLSARGNVADVRQHPDHGISGSVDRHPVRVGPPNWIGLSAVDGPGVTVAVEVDARLLGTITVVDTVRPTAPAAVSALQALGVESVLVTGATPLTASAVAAEAGVATILPRGTDDATTDLPSPPDAVALLSARPPGSAVALRIGPDSAHITTDECDVHEAAVAITTCRAVARTTRGAIRIAVAVQGVAVLLAMVGLLPPWGAALIALAGSLVMAGIVRRLLGPVTGSAGTETVAGVRTKVAAAPVTLPPDAVPDPDVVPDAAPLGVPLDPECPA